MHCPFCSADDTKVIDSRLIAEGGQVRRRRQCVSCGERFTTFESPELLMPHIVKRDKSREPFNEAKLYSGLKRALGNRPVSVERVDEAVNRIKASLRATGEREVDSLALGEAVMKELRDLDQVAYVRFASVYRRFEDVDDFRAEVDRLSKGASKGRGRKGSERKTQNKKKRNAKKPKESKESKDKKKQKR